MSLEALRPHLRSDPARPAAIPYRTAYYQRDWAFCLAHDDLQRLQPGSLTYGECVLPGASEREILLFTHVCHPSMANDNASGIAVATELARAWRNRPREHTLCVVFAPGTIGSITWLAKNEARLGRIDHGLVLGLLGDGAPLTYKKSRRGEALVDRVARARAGAWLSRCSRGGILALRL
jgi:aminopeptidase-like protein